MRWRGLVAGLLVVFMLAGVAPAQAEPRCPVLMVLNGSEMCAPEDAPESYRVAVYQDGRYVGDRNMYPVRAVSERLGAVVEWECYDPGAGYCIAEFVWIGNRHRTIKLVVGQPTAQVWDLQDDGTLLERAPVEMDARPERSGGSIFLPIRHVVEMLGGSASWDRGQVSVEYRDLPTAYDFRQAERRAYNVRDLYSRGVYTADDVYYLGDYGAYLDAAEAAVDLGWAQADPVSFVQFAYLKLMSEHSGPLVTEHAYSQLGQFVFTNLGLMLSAEERREIGRNAEHNLDILARHYGLTEQAKLRDGTEIDLRVVNDWKRASINRPGADRIYVLPDDKGYVESWIFFESKGTTRARIVPSHFGKNESIDAGLDRMARSSNPTVAEVARIIRLDREAALRMLESGEMTLEQYRDRFVTTNVGTSPAGEGSSRLSEAKDPTFVTDKAGQKIRIVGGPVPRWWRRLFPGADSESK